MTEQILRLSKGKIVAIILIDILAQGMMNLGGK